MSGQPGSRHATSVTRSRIFCFPDLASGTYNCTCLTYSDPDLLSREPSALSCLSLFSLFTHGIIICSIKSISKNVTSAPVSIRVFTVITLIFLPKTQDNFTGIWNFIPPGLNTFTDDFPINEKLETGFRANLNIRRRHRSWSFFESAD